MELILIRDKSNNDELVEYLRSKVKDFVLWFSADVVKEFSLFRQIAMKGESPVKLLRQFEKVLYAIRKDLGNSNHNLKPDELLRIFINDIEKM